MREIIYVDIDDMDVKFFNWGAEVKYFTPDCDLEYLLVFDCERLNKADRELWNDDSTPFTLNYHRHDILRYNINAMLVDVYKNGEKDNTIEVVFFKVPAYVDVEECKKDVKRLLYSVSYVSSEGFSFSASGKTYHAIIELKYNSFFSEYTFVSDWEEILKMVDNAENATIRILHKKKKERVFLGTIKDFEGWI